MSIKRIFIAISAIFAASAVFADNSSVTSKKYVDDLMSGYQGKLPGAGANTLMIYDNSEDGIGEKSIETTLVSNATGVPTVGAVKTGLDGKQDTITGTAGYVMTGTGNAGSVGERGIYGAAFYGNSLVTAENVNDGVINAVNSSLIRVDENGDPSDSGTLWEINTDLFAIGVLPAGYTQLEWIESDGTQYIDTGIVPNNKTRWELDNEFTAINLPNFSFNGIYQSNPIFRFDIALSNTNLLLNYGNTNNVSSAPNNFLNNRMVYKVDAKSGTWAYGSTTGTLLGYTFVSNNKSIYLFARNDHLNSVDTVARFSNQKTYSSKIYQDDVLVQYLVPAKNSSDVVGMYDTVSGQFFTNQGTGEFIAGPPVEN